MMTITRDFITCTGLNPHNHYTISAKVVPTPKANINYLHECWLVGIAMALAIVLLLITIVSDATAQEIQIATFFLAFSCFVSIAAIGPKIQLIVSLIISLAISETLNYYELITLKKST